jgi:hypothetical protein
VVAVMVAVGLAVLEHNRLLEQQIVVVAAVEIPPTWELVLLVVVVWLLYGIRTHILKQQH